MKRIINEMKLRLPAKSVNEAVARSVISAFIAQLDPTVEELGDIRCAVSEAVTNSIVHAYRSLPESEVGYIYISVRLYDTREVSVEISDNGCGIETEKLRNIFTGYLGNDTQKADRSKGNMNIGLSLCAAIIKAHGGEIWAYNNTDGGASFSFSLITEATENEQ